MTGFLLYAFLGIVTVMLTVLGGHVSSNNRKYRYTFYILGAISAVLILLTGYQNYLVQIEGDKSRKQLADSIHSLRNSSVAIANMSKEALRVGSLNTKLQERLLKASSTIENLSKEGIKTAIGGESFCYLSAVFGLPDRNTWIPTFTHSGKYTIYDVYADIADLDREKNEKVSKLPFPLNATQARIQIHVGNLSGGGYILYDKQILISGKERQGYNIFFFAKNGTWMQMLRLAKINGQWSQATKVFRGKKQIIEQVGSDFPKDVNWQ